MLLLPLVLVLLLLLFLSSSQPGERCAGIRLGEKISACVKVRLYRAPLYPSPPPPPSAGAGGSRPRLMLCAWLRRARRMARAEMSMPWMCRWIGRFAAGVGVGVDGVAPRRRWWWWLRRECSRRSGMQPVPVQRSRMERGREGWVEEGEEEEEERSWARREAR